MIEVIQMIEQVSCNRFDLKRCIFPYYVYYITCHDSGDHVTNTRNFLRLITLQNGVKKPY
ncbi:hypothetical protein Hanom_Chr12g01181391 [Helianthus anomalus]